MLAPRLGLGILIGQASSKICFCRREASKPRTSLTTTSMQTHQQRQLVSSLANSHLSIWPQTWSHKLNQHTCNCEAQLCFGFREGCGFWNRGLLAGTATATLLCITWPAWATTARMPGIAILRLSGKYAKAHIKIPPLYPIPVLQTPRLWEMPNNHPLGPPHGMPISLSPIHGR